jgi:hypothetical protein
LLSYSSRLRRLAAAEFCGNDWQGVSIGVKVNRPATFM